MAYYTHVSTGWDDLDAIIDHLRRGDNVVWQVDTIDQYQKLVTLFVNKALSDQERVVYLRFARHLPLLEARPNLRIHTLNVEHGFEHFSTQVHTIITEEGRNTFFVFDSLSDLLHAWASDMMIVNFFFITCPYLYELNTIAYFAIIRNRHSFKAIARIREITQLLVDIHDFQRQICVHPIKVQDRYSPTMFFPHVKERDQLLPVINSVEATQLFNQLSESIAIKSQRHLDFWDHMFIQAEGLLASDATADEKMDKVEQLSRILLTRNKAVLGMIRKYLALGDLIQIKERVVGTGYIGGKSLGMLLSRKIVEQELPADWPVVEHHDSFYVGSDVFYSYIVQNGWWKLFMEHKTPEGYFEKGFELQEKLLNGSFPETIRERFQLMLEYFGQSPIIVRSSSLLEDAFGSAFAGKYESFFCVNQGSPEQRYEQFELAVRRIFASTMSADALSYRLQRGLSHLDEQMALLVQRVSGAYNATYFFPALAGVGLSLNPYVWKKGLEPSAGMLRLVMGLGTRAVDRVESDYPRIVHLDDPLLRPSSAIEDLRRYSQQYVDVLNLELNELQTISLREIAAKGMNDQLRRTGVRDNEASGYSSEERWILTFDPFLTETPFVPLVSRVLSTLEGAYGVPVDIEFTVNFGPSGGVQVNLLQCRPLQSHGPGAAVAMPEDVAPEATIIRTRGDFMGGNVSLPIECIIWVDPSAYVELSMSEKYSVARLIGKLNRTVADPVGRPTLLIGPGRWGTHMPAMGVPVRFSEINHVSALAEVSYQDGNLIPELSFGSHFFHDLLETRIFYVAVYQEKPDVILNTVWLQQQPNALDRLLPAEGGRLSRVVRVVLGRFLIRSAIASQEMICFRF
jgi:hypothetical protein